MRDAKISTFGRTALLALGSLALLGCGEPPAVQSEQPSGIQSGVWLLAGSAHPQVGLEDPCRPMMMQVSISSSSVTFERRTFLCYSDTYSFNRVAYVRDGEKLRIGEQVMGSFSERKLEVDLPYGAGSISWDLNRGYETYRENSQFGLFVAYPQLRPDSTPVAIHTVLKGKESLPLIGRIHAARLPETIVKYGFEDTLAHCQLESLDPATGLFRVQPDANFSGTDGFPFWPIVDDVALPGETVELQIKGRPAVPLVEDIVFSAAEDFPMAITPVVTNPDSLKYTLAVVDPPQHGKVVLEGSEPDSWDFIYKPDPEYNGPDSFTYAAVVGQEVGPKALVTISVMPVNDPPISGDVNVSVVPKDATVISLPISDIDSPFLEVVVDTLPLHGQVYGNDRELVYVPDPDFVSGTDSFTYVAVDFESASKPSVVNISMVPGNYPSRLLVDNVTSAVIPVWSDPFGTTIHYEASTFGAAPSVGIVGFGLTSQVIQEREEDTFGFDSPNEHPTSATFFSLDSHLYFTTSTAVGGIRTYKSIALSSEKLADIPAPSNNLIAEPAVGTPFIAGNDAFLPIHWQTADSNYTCQIWKITTSTSQPELIHAFPPNKTPCLGLGSLGSSQYLFVGAELLQLNGPASMPVVLKDLGNAMPLPWLVEAGGKLFFQTRTEIQGDTQIDLWATDGTVAGTQIVKQIEKSPKPFDIFSPVVVADKLYFAHQKSLWSSDGTGVGTNIIKTIDVTNVIGDGAIGKMSPIGGRLFFLATSDTFGREPWISDGTTAGTKMLADVRPGTLGSSVPSANPNYFFEWNGIIYFLANDGADAFGLWTTDGTKVGTKLLRKRDMTTIVGFHTNKLVYHHGPHIFEMALQ